MCWAGRWCRWPVARYTYIYLVPGHQLWPSGVFSLVDRYVGFHNPTIPASRARHETLDWSLLTGGAQVVVVLLINWSRSSSKVGEFVETWDNSALTKRQSSVCVFSWLSWTSGILINTYVVATLDYRSSATGTWLSHRATTAYCNRQSIQIRFTSTLAKNSNPYVRLGHDYPNRNSAYPVELSVKNRYHT